MTQDEQERELIDARTYLSVCPSLRLDRSRHESVAHTSIWIFQANADGVESQIACIVHDGLVDGRGWRVNALHRGSPVTERRVSTLLDAIGEMMRATKNGGA